MSSRQWYIQYNDSILGPFSSKQLRQMAERSNITPNVKIRVGENGKWRQASSVKGLFSNSSLTKNSSANTSSSSSELSSEDIPASTDYIASNASSELSSAELSSELSSESIAKPESQPNSTPEASLGEMPSAAPPLPGEIPVSGDIPVPGEIPPPILPNSMSFGERPSPPPPVKGERLGWEQISNNHFSGKKQFNNSIPDLIQKLIGEDERILYAAHPATTVLFIQCGLTAAAFFLFGIIPFLVMIFNDSPSAGIGWMVYSIIFTAIILAVVFLKWFRACYVITSERTFVKRGIFSVEIGYVYNANIQMLKIRTGLIDHILHLNTIELRTSAGFLTLRWIPLAEVLQYYRK